MVRVVQSVRIDEMRFVQSEALRRCVHVVGEILDRAGDAFRDHHRDIVGRFDHQHFERVVEGHLCARAKAHFRRRHPCGARRHDERRVHGQLARAHGVERDVDGHELGERSRIPGFGRLVLDQDLSAVGVGDEEGRRFRGASDAAEGEGDAESECRATPDRPNAKRHVASLFRRRRKGWNS